MEFNRNTESFCPCCVSIKPKNSFLSNLTEKNKVLPYCKDCIKLKYKNALSATKNKDVAAWSICVELGIPLIKEAYEITNAEMEEKKAGSSRTPDIILAYYKTLQEQGVKYNGNYDSDMYLCDFKDEKGQIEKKPSRLEEMVERDNWNRIWGKDFNNEECIKLDEYYNAYTENLYDMDTAMMLRYRDLCKAELRKFQNGSDKEATDEILKLMKILKIDDFKKDSKDDTDRFIDKLIWTIEETEPAEEEDREKYADIAGYEKYFHEIMRSLRNLLCNTREFPDIPKAEK